VILRGTAAGDDEDGAAAAAVEEQAAAADEDVNQSKANVVDVDKSSKPTSPAGQTTLADDTAADSEYSVLGVPAHQNSHRYHRIYMGMDICKIS